MDENRLEYVLDLLHERSLKIEHIIMQLEQCLENNQVIINHIREALDNH